MTFSASYRTDILAFYALWFLARLRVGYCRVVNPYGGGGYEVSLAPGDVDGFVFWTRNMRPLMAPPEQKRDLLARLAAITAEHGIASTLCSQPELLVPGLGEARCIDAERPIRCRAAPYSCKGKR